MSALPETVTFGCRLNSHESEVMQRQAERAGLRDAIIVNTCSVTAEAERQARQSIRRLRRDRPGTRIFVTGCASTIDPASFSSMAEVDGIIPNDRKLEVSTFQHLVGGGTHRSSILSDMGGQSIASLRNTRSVQRAFVAVQNGCDHRCTFCIIPFGRGPSRSETIGKIAAEVQKRVDEGYEEIVFTGVDIASYGTDLPGRPRLGQMVRRVLALVPQVRRLRLSSVDPAAIDEDIWRLLGEEQRLMPHLHLSLQAGDDLILKRMKRRHNRDDIFRLCDRARTLRPDIAFGADLIAGFPTETDAMFENGCDLVSRCGLTWLHVFPYSARKGTPAAKMPQINGAVRKERAEHLRRLGKDATERHMAGLVGGQIEVLVEKAGLGCTPHFAKIPLDAPAPIGELVRAFCYRGADGQVAASPL